MILLIAAALLASQDTAAIGRAVRVGITSGVYPGAVVVIGTADTILLASGYGHYTWSPGSRVPDPDSSLYDLASVSKVVATTAAAMLLADRGRLSLSRPVQDYLPQFAGAGKSGVTVRHLLEHRSGMRAWLRLDTLARDSGAARLIVLADSLLWEPGGRVVYSDLNAMLLGWVVEAVAGAPLDVVAHRAVFRPLGMTQTRYRPERALRPRTVPVGLWRGHAIAGELHDQNAARLGGVAGHAGLYSTGRDLARFAQFMLRHGMLPDSTPLARAGAIDLFTRRGPGNRALGWEMRDTTERGSAGDSLSAGAYGHTGYTGTSIWIDPERDVFVILLTNRVFAPRHRRSISALRAIRANVADAAALLRAACRRPGC
jgi:CubicO group peptidase (beta-lactamase class C family)